MTIGVGLLFNGVLEEFFVEHPDAVDFVSVIPDRFWQDAGRNRDVRFTPLPDELAILETLASRYPLVAHGVGLSIASACTFDLDHVRQLATWHRRFGFLWISEHLAAVRVRTELTLDHHAGLALPLPWDRDVLDMLCDRVSRVQEIIGRQLLLENGVVHTPVPDAEMSEVEFLNELCQRTGCGLLLDLHNLYVNAVNLELDADKFLDELKLGFVGEIHVAGGNKLYGVYLDSHAGPCPAEVWRLLRKVVPRCPNLAGVTFEFHESYYSQLGVGGILDQLQKIRGAIHTSSRLDPCRSPISNVHLQT